jgi:pimeloyl-ACP methyl ester carboxylesterase
MALLNVNAADRQDGCAPAGETALAPALDALAPGRPVTIMVHGFRFLPGDPAHDPHRHILSLSPRADCWKAVSWPRHLHLDRPGAGLGLGFGWPARGTLPEVAARALTVGGQLARLIGTLHRHRPDAPVQIVAHSLGARVALAALARAPEGAVRRLVLMAGAEYRDAAARALASPGAAACQALNVTSLENAPFDLMFRLAVAPDRAGDLPLSAGLGAHGRAIDLRIDTAATRAALAALGHRIRPPAKRVCHWSGYMRPGLFSVYRRLLDPADPDFPDVLRAALGAAECPRQASPALPVRVPVGATLLASRALRSQV